MGFSTSATYHYSSQRSDTLEGITGSLGSFVSFILLTSPRDTNLQGVDGNGIHILWRLWINGP